MVDKVKGVHPPYELRSPGWDNLSIMIECTPESGHCQTVRTLCQRLLHLHDFDGGKSISRAIGRVGLKISTFLGSEMAASEASAI
jgi:hypothetical protein